MSWGTSEGGIPQPYRMEVKAAHWDLARNRDGELVITSRGANLLNLIFEGKAWRLVENADGGYDLGDEIEPIDGKFNRRSFLLGNTEQWIDPREDGKKVESVRGPGEFPWAKSEVGRLINSLIETVGVDELETWGDWTEAESFAGHTFDLVPHHDTDKDGNPVVYKTKDGTERIDWYFVAAAVDVKGGGKEKAKAPSKTADTSTTTRRRRGGDDTDLATAVKAAWKEFDGSEDEFIDFIQAPDFAHAAALAKLSDDEFDAVVDKAIN